MIRLWDPLKLVRPSSWSYGYVTSTEHSASLFSFLVQLTGVATNNVRTRKLKISFIGNQRLVKGWAQ